MPRLHQAVTDIVAATRGVFVEQGHATHGHNIDLRLPVLFSGTDMRCTIEAGPSTARRNAIENAQMHASGKPATEPGLDARQEAVQLLTMYATEFKDSESLAGRFIDPDDEAFFTRIVNAIKALDLPEGVVAE